MKFYSLQTATMTQQISPRTLVGRWMMRWEGILGSVTSRDCRLSRSMIKFGKGRWKGHAFPKRAHIPSRIGNSTVIGEDRRLASHVTRRLQAPSNNITSLSLPYLIRDSRSKSVKIPRVLLMVAHGPCAEMVQWNVPRVLHTFNILRCHGAVDISGCC